MRSLSRTLIIGTTAGTAAILVAAGIALFFLVRHGLISQFDQSLVDEARLLASTVEDDMGTLDLEFADLDMREFRGQSPLAYLQLRSVDGAVIYESSASGELHTPMEPAVSRSPQYQFARLPDGSRGRAVSFEFTPREEGATQDARGTGLAENGHAEPTSLLLIRSTKVIDQILVRLRLLLVAVGMISVTLASVLLWWLVRHSLRPLENLACEIAEVNADDLGRQVDGESCPQEFQPVVAKLNDLLRRLEIAFRRERTLNANVAHELRTPLTGLRLKMDVARSKDREPHEYRVAIDQCREITVEMQSMVEKLLSLAKFEAGQAETRPEHVELNDLLNDTWSHLELIAARRRLQVQWELGPHISLMNDPSMLAVVARNVLENAAIHSDEEGTVRITTTAANGVAEIAVTNTGSKLSQAEADTAFDQFWRHDKARSGTNAQCGLGLSLVKKAVSILQGTVSARSEPGGEFEIRVSVPQCCQSPSSSGFSR